tara:strand:+ start:1157 stop:3139 length:1983 start_codon:yes stop_codon:yes gene_type:complete
MAETREYKINGENYKLTGEKEADFDSALKTLTQKLSGREDFIDDTTGAPPAARLAVGGAEGEDRAATLRNLGYKDVRETASGLAFRNPKTNRMTLYNAPGLDLGDVVSITPEVAEAAGAIGGAVLAAPPAIAAAPFTGGASLTAIMGGSALGSQVAREGENLLAKSLFGRVDTRDLPQKFQDVAVRGLLNAPQGPPVGQTTRRALGVSENAPENLARMERLGITPTAANVSESPLLQRVTEATGIFGGANPYGKMQQQVLEQFSEAGRKFVANFNKQNKSDLEVVQSLQVGARKAKQSFRDTQDKAFTKFYALFDRATPVQMTNTKGLQAQLDELPPDLRGMLSAELNQFLPLVEKAAQGGTLPFQAVRSMRTKVGELMGSTSTNSKELASIYGALSKDLDAAVLPAGEAAQKAYKVANRYTRFRENTTMPLIDDILSKGLDKQLLDLINAEARGNAGQSMQRLRNILPKAAYDEVVGVVFNRAGRGTPGTQTVGDDIMAQADDWSPRKFLTFWSGLTPESKKAFIGGTPYRDLRKPLDDIVRASEQLKDAEKFRNFSNTGGALIWASVLGAGGTTSALLDTAAGGAVSMSVLSGYGLQKVMQNPRFVHWLSKAPSQVKGSKSLADYVGRLAYVATVEPEIKDEIDQLVRQLSARIPDAR